MPPITIIKSNRRRSIAIEIRNGEVTVRAPDFVSNKAVNEFVSSRQKWIDKTLSNGKSLPRQEFQSGQPVYISGKLVEIEFQHSRAGNCNLLEDKLTIGIPGNVIKPEVYALKKFDTWLIQESELHLKTKILDLANAFGLEHRLNSVKFRYTKSKWGHCSSTGEIQINPRIMMAAEPIQHYLIAHEISHLRHMNHSKQFWELVSVMDPDHKQHRNWLRENQHQTLLLKS